MNDDTLTLYYYGDGLGADERRDVEAALAADADLAAHYRRLCADLENLEAAPAPKLPNDMLQRLHDGLDRAAAAPPVHVPRIRMPWPRVHVSSFFWGAALTATLAIARR